jgi:hypothetical protein
VWNARSAHAGTLQDVLHPADEPAITSMIALDLNVNIYDCNDDRLPLAWDGHRFHLPSRPDKSWGASLWWHELSHWLVATRRERTWINYGLGAQVNTAPITFHAGGPLGALQPPQDDPTRIIDPATAALRENLAVHLALFEPWFATREHDAVAKRALTLWHDFGGDSYGYTAAQHSRLARLIARALGPLTTATGQARPDTGDIADILATVHRTDSTTQDYVDLISQQRR